MIDLSDVPLVAINPAGDSNSGQGGRSSPDGEPFAEYLDRVSAALELADEAVATPLIEAPANAPLVALPSAFPLLQPAEDAALQVAAPPPPPVSTADIDPQWEAVARTQVAIDAPALVDTSDVENIARYVLRASAQASFEASVANQISPAASTATPEATAATGAPPVIPVGLNATAVAADGEAVAPTVVPSPAPATPLAGEPASGLPTVREWSKDSAVHRDGAPADTPSSESASRVPRHRPVDAAATGLTRETVFAPFETRAATGQQPTQVAQPPQPSTAATAAAAAETAGVPTVESASPAAETKPSRVVSTTPAAASPVLAAGEGPKTEWTIAADASAEAALEAGESIEAPRATGLSAGSGGTSGFGDRDDQAEPAPVVLDPVEEDSTFEGTLSSTSTEPVDTPKSPATPRSARAEAQHLLNEAMVRFSRTQQDNLWERKLSIDLQSLDGQPVRLTIQPDGEGQHRVALLVAHGRLKEELRRALPEIRDAVAQFPIDVSDVSIDSASLRDGQAVARLAGRPVSEIGRDE